MIRRCIKLRYKLRRKTLSKTRELGITAVAMLADLANEVSHLEGESIEKHVEWDLMPELTITSPYVHSRADSNTFTMSIGQPYARVDR